MKTIPRKKLFSFILVFSFLFLLPLASSFSLDSFLAQFGIGSVTSSCLDISSSAICKNPTTFSSTLYQKISGDCSSVGVGFQCYDLIKPTTKNYIGPACISVNTLCKNAFLSNGYFQCDLGNSVNCPRTLVNGIYMGGCFNGVCGTSTSPISTPICSQGYEKCQNGDRYECKDGTSWVLKEDCSSTETCINQGNYATCKPNQIYYCQNGQGGCFWSSTNSGTCFSSEAECKSSIGICCEYPSSGRFSWEHGSCGVGGLPSSGTHVTQDSCLSKDPSANECMIPQFWSSATDPYGHKLCFVKKFSLSMLPWWFFPLAIILLLYFFRKSLLLLPATWIVILVVSVISGGFSIWKILF